MSLQKKIIIFCCCFTTIVLAKENNKRVVPILSWSFDNVTSSSGIISEGASSYKVEGNIKPVQGVAGKAVFLNGKTWIDCGNKPEYNLQYPQFTVTVWIKPIIIPDKYCGIIGKFPTGEGNRGYEGWTLYYAAWNHSYSFRFKNKAGKNFIVSVPPYGMNSRWNHLAAVYDGNILRLYINGKLRKSVNASGLPAVNKGNLLIGKLYNDSPGGCFVGAIDEIKIYNVALSGKIIKKQISPLLKKNNIRKTTNNALRFYYPSPNEGMRITREIINLFQDSFSEIQKKKSCSLMELCDSEIKHGNGKQ